MIVVTCAVDVYEASRRGFDSEPVANIPVVAENLPFAARDVLAANMNGCEFNGPMLPEPTENGLREVLTKMISDAPPQLPPPTNNEDGN